MLPGAASAAPPGSCDTSSDFGVWDATHNSSHVGGTSYNCGASWDYVMIVVDNASDSNCNYVGPYTSKHIAYNPLLWSAIGGHSRSWVRCT